MCYLDGFVSWKIQENKKQQMCMCVADILADSVDKCGRCAHARPYEVCEGAWRLWLLSSIIQS